MNLFYNNSYQIYNDIIYFYIYKGKGSAAIFSKRSYSSSIDLSTMKAEGCKEAICTVL